MEVKTINKDEKGRTLFYCAVDVLLFKDGKVALVRRANTGWNDGNYILPGGHIEVGETIETAASEELKEEIGVIAKPEDIEIFHVLKMNTGKEYIQYFVKCKEWTGIPQIQPETENGKTVYKADDLRFFDLDNLPHNIVKSSKIAIDAYLSGKSFSTLGYDNSPAYQRSHE